MAESADFTYTDEPQVHNTRRREILLRHPEVRKLAGYHLSTPVAIVAIVPLQLGAAWFVRELGIGWALLSAYLVGAVLSHALYALIHECSHNLALPGGSTANKVMGIVCDLPLGVPSATVFRTFHLLHHRYLGEFEMDPDMVSRREARLVGNSWWRKALWMSLFAVSQAMRPLRIPGAKLAAVWVTANFLLVFLVDALVLFLWGPASLVYLLASTLFALGLHPLGGRWIQEHYVTEPGQETYSYYGPGNLVSFNIGYHNEHHDFMNVPWIHLPKVRRAAPDAYDGLNSYRSWTAVIARFVFDPRLSPYSRIVHPDSRRLQRPTEPGEPESLPASS